MSQYVTSSDSETQDVARALAPHLQPGDLLLLRGDLAAGKTTFVQGLAAGLGIERRITSPTFTLHQSYRGRLELHHLDLYRLKKPEELSDLGLPDLLDTAGVVAVEWPELMLDRLDLPEFLDIGFDTEAQDRRIVRFEFRGESWMHRRATVEADLARWRRRSGPC